MSTSIDFGLSGYFLLSGITRVLWETTNKESSLFKDQSAAVYIFRFFCQGRSFSINVGAKGLVFVNETFGFQVWKWNAFPNNLSIYYSINSFRSPLSIKTIHLSLETKTGDYTIARSHKGSIDILKCTGISMSSDIRYSVLRISRNKVEFENCTCNSRDQSS